MESLLESDEKNYCEIKIRIHERIKVICILILVLWSKNTVNKTNALIFKSLIVTCYMVLRPGH